VFVSFEPLVFLIWVFVSAFLPGAVISFSIFKKDDFLWIEKLFMGFALGMILLPLIPFLLYFIAGIHYSYTIALLSVALLYVIALAFLVKGRLYEGIKLPELPKLKEGGITVSKATAVSLLLLLVIVLAYMVRMGSYSPVFQELDPYYYTYVAHQLLTLGENPPDDQTAWYPEHIVNHRTIPEISYLEALWYSLYTGGGEYSHMLLATIAAMYPPIAAMLSVFFIFLFVSAVTGKREWGLVSAGLAAFVPFFILKLAGGEAEVQPYAFFSMAFFYAMYALSLLKKDHRYSVLAGLGFAAVALGSASQIVILLSVIMFLALHSIVLYLRDKDGAGLRYLAESNAIVFVIGPMVGSAILKDVFMNDAPSLAIAAPFLMMVAFVALLYYLKQRIPERDRSMLALGVVLVAGLVVFAATPIGDYVKGQGKSAFAIAEFRVPLQRTIAEQNLAAAALGDSAGFIAERYEPEPDKDRPTVVSMVFWPVIQVLNLASEDMAAKSEAFLESIFAIIFLAFSVIVNLVLAIFVGLVNLVLGTSVEFTEKANSFLLFWVFMFWLAVAWSAARFIRNEENNLSILMLTFIMPAFVVGIIKAKYTIYSAVLLAMAIGFTLAEANRYLNQTLKDEKERTKAYRAILAIGFLLVFFQFAHKGFAPSLVWGSMVPLYQNDPDGLAPKFQDICDQTGDADACAVALDPMGYAERGTNYQYSYKLCLLSIISNHSHSGNLGLAPVWEQHTVSFRCQRISSYWIDSMEWIRDNTEEGSRTTSWWDYGHWINYFGQKNAVLRNEHRSTEMIGAVADGYLDATPEELKAWMEAHDSEYALFDMELVMGGGSVLGGKYGALNYLQCAHNNETTVAKGPGQSICESEHLWEMIYVSNHGCTISQLSNKTGVVAYKVYVGDYYIPMYPGNCVDPKTPNDIAYCRAVSMVPTYCVGDVMLATGESSVATYYLNETYPNGDLKLNKAVIQLPFQYYTSHIGAVTGATLLYTHDNMWVENGAITSGYEDRKGKFYDSNIYKALFLNDLPGFELVYTSPGGAVKIYKIAD
jgi:asparagine N-glycosylation enzyme membrane subunit Stt3